MSENKKYSIRTDLAMEACELLNREITEDDGIKTETKMYEDIEVTYVKITNKKGSKTVGKPIGKYITVASDKMKGNDADFRKQVIEKTAEALSEIMNNKKHNSILIAGLGNRYITPDALGPKVVSKILVTRHIKNTLPENIDDNVASVAAIAPGVMGITGIETGEILLGIVEKIKPDILIAIDALAARKFSRINSVIQIADSGISPGSGVGNKRMMLDKESLGIPVIAIGVPTVVDAATLVNDTMDRILTEMSKVAKDKAFYDMLQDIEGEERYSLISELLEPYAENMFVTPKEVDEVIERLAEIISNAINIAVHPALSAEDINKYV
ncbi:Germination protease [bioreactor metagenome]|uniref:Germination protease n=1 Tax=bioreactor metagenome TaxID=1076179 RepID=A0A644YNL8_9ZZZZ|nr:GPR endopeptidase [Candidatus Metalachnospira sp.]